MSCCCRLWFGAFLLFALSRNHESSAFSIQKISPRQTSSVLSATASSSAGQGFGSVVADAPTKKKSVSSVLSTKQKLLDLLPRMMGTDEEFRLVEQYVNELESMYEPAQTLGFFNLCVAGEWQLLFSTNLSGGPRPNFRLRELYQRVNPSNLEGNVTNIAQWDLVTNNDEGQFDATGTFSVQTSYSINQGARMVLNEPQHTLLPARGSAIPKDVPALVGLLHRSMPKELFDGSDHAMDTTYLDADLRIVRMTGPRLEGVRDIFIRRGSMEIDPASD